MWIKSEANTLLLLRPKIQGTVWGQNSSCAVFLALRGTILFCLFIGFTLGHFMLIAYLLLKFMTCILHRLLARV